MVQYHTLRTLAFTTKVILSVHNLTSYVKVTTVSGRGERGKARVGGGAYSLTLSQRPSPKLQLLYLLHSFLDILALTFIAVTAALVLSISATSHYNTHARCRYLVTHAQDHRRALLLDRRAPL